MGCKNSVIPDDGSVTAIGEDAFAGKELKEIIIPVEITEIKRFAFSGCGELTDIYYTGSEQQKTQIVINNDYQCNKYLLNATWHYNYAPHTPGDVNGDGNVNNKDLTRLFQHLSNWDVEVSAGATDVNGDGNVNNKDLTRLFQYLSDWDVEIF